MRTPGRPTARHLLAIAAAAALLAGCSPASGPLGTPSTPTPTGDASVAPPSGDATPGQPSPVPSPSGALPTTAASPAGSAAAPTSGSADTVVVRVYFPLNLDNTVGLVPVLREIPATKGVAAAAVRQLLRGPNPKELGASPAMSTAIPDGTELLGISIADRVATVDLSREFASGGGSLSMLLRVAQVVYTVTQFPTVDAVRFELDGQPVSSIGGEGVIVSPPVGREAFRGQLPAIFVDRPAWGAAAGNPAVVSGVANVFEAAFRARILDAGGAVLVDQPVQASCGTGCWGEFAVSLAYTVGQPQWGTLRVYDLSAKDGTPENVAEYPVWLTPGG